MVIGYILADIIIGPYALPFSLIQNVNSLNTFAVLFFDLGPMQHTYLAFLTVVFVEHVV
jgi:hypothetical protein